MYDIHCHILPGVDDGPATVEEALKIAFAAQQAGIKAIVCTPHYIEEKYKSNSESNLTMLDSFKEALKMKGIDIQLYLGNEVHITPNLIGMLDSKAITTLNNSRYILVEMPVYSKPLYADDIIFKLKLSGLVPVIAHPERYEWISRNPKELRNMIDRGCLTQLNIASISGYYGQNTKKAAKALIRENCIHLLGSDSHTSNRIYNDCKANFRTLQKLSSEYLVKQILQNTEAIVNNQEVSFNY